MKTPYAKTPASRRAALLLAALSSCTVASAVDATYQYFRFTPIKLRNDSTANSIQVAEFQFLKSGAPLPWAGAAVTNPGGNRPGAELPSNLIDGLPGTKWLDFYRNPVVFAFTSQVTIDGYRFTTANDANERDPVRWILEGSNDEIAWVVLDHLQADFATPTGRATVTPDILLGAATTPYAKTWAGGDPANWDTVTANWDDGTPVVWNNASTDIARFGAGTPATVSLAEPISARAIDFTAPVTLLEGNTLTFTNVTRLNPGADMAITSVIAGNVGVIKTGPQTLTLSANNTFTGPLQVRAGTVIVSGTNAYNGQTLVAGGGTLSFTGASTKAAGALEVGNAAGDGTLNLDSSAALVFNGTPVVGNGALTPGAGAIRQSSGTVTFSQDTQYLNIANTTGSYGSYELSGGTASTPTGSGLRVGWNGPGVLTQSGGSLSCGRWFVVGGASSRGVATFTGGTATTNASYRLIGGDQVSGNGTINIGTAAGGTSVFSAIRTATGANDGSIVLGAANSSTANLNLNSGVLKVHGRIYRQSTGHRQHRFPQPEWRHAPRRGCERRTGQQLANGGAHASRRPDHRYGWQCGHLRRPDQRADRQWSGDHQPAGRQRRQRLHRCTLGVHGHHGHGQRGHGDCHGQRRSGDRPDLDLPGRWLCRRGYDLLRFHRRWRGHAGGIRGVRARCRRCGF
ncbi:autotransporter-associated beta strand repeat-containing protein [Luteolibacter sp. Populi]|uniref:autotransporter-associated beta strand repeat-containing protein n=1 Tax=Luteolibacter sp. Populi TaxID=3230487 RepID=UPI0034663CC0